MTKEEKIKAKLARMKAIKRWSDRLKDLKSREKNKMNQADFCRIYDINHAQLSRAKSENSEFTVREDFFLKVESALKSEKV